MDSIEYKEKYFRLKDEFNQEVLKLHQEYIERNARFKVGDFVGNIVGILKVVEVTGTEPSTHSSYEGDAPIIKYFGVRYKKAKGKLLRTKYDTKGTISDHFNNSLDLIKVKEVDGELYYKPTIKRK